LTLDSVNAIIQAEHWKYKNLKMVVSEIKKAHKNSIMKGDKLWIMKRS